MRLKISHTTEYTYDDPVQYSLQRLRLTPKTQPGQIVRAWATTVHGARVEAGYTDHFGNHVDLVSTNAEQVTIRIVAEGEVETEDRAGVFGPHQGFVPLWLYLRETPLYVMKKNAIAHDTVPHFMQRFAGAYTAQLQDFARNVLHKRPAPVTIDDGLAAVRIAVAAQRSFESGRPAEVGAV